MCLWWYSTQRELRRDNLSNITSVSWKYQLGLPGKVCGKEIPGLGGALVSRARVDCLLIYCTSWCHPEWCLGDRGRGVWRSLRPAAGTYPGSKTEHFGLVWKSGRFPVERQSQRAADVKRGQQSVHIQTVCYSSILSGAGFLCPFLHWK